MSTRGIGCSWRLHGVAIVGSAFGAIACASRPPDVVRPVHPSNHAARCEIIGPPEAMADSLWVAIADTLRPHDAPAAHTSGERVVFPLLYDAAARPRCDGAAAAPGMYAITASTDTTLDLSPRQPRTAPHLHVTSIAEQFGRDALDAGADVVITSDPNTIAYAAAQPDLASVPLAWDHVYLLIHPGPSTGVADSALAVKTDLATGALRVEARPATDSAWWASLGNCPAFATPANGSGVASRSLTTARIVFDQQDQVARALSERLVALAYARTPRLAALTTALSGADSVRAVGVDATTFREALAAGREAAYVTRVPRDESETCFELDTLRLHAPWLWSPDAPIAGHLTPLVETRARAIVRRARVGIAVDSAGNVALEFGPSPRS